MQIHLLDKVNYQTYLSWLDKLYVAARVCYSNKSIKDLVVEAFMKSIQQKEKFIEEHIIGPGHWSVLEHVSLTFVFESVSRSMTHQLVRHRHLSFSQRSQRYCKLQDEDNFLILPDRMKGNKDVEKLTLDLEDHIQEMREELALLGFKEEDIRFIYPNGMKTTIVVTGNLRSLFEAMGKRLCSRAQSEIRVSFSKLKEELERVLPENNIVTKYMVPKCKICQEKKDCELSK